MLMLRWCPSRERNRTVSAGHRSAVTTASTQNYINNKRVGADDRKEEKNKFREDNMYLNTNADGETRQNKIEGEKEIINQSRQSLLFCLLFLFRC